MFSEKMLANQKLLNVATDWRKILKKRDRKKVRKISAAIINIFLLLLFLLGNIFGKTLFILLHFYYKLIIGNPVIKHQHPYKYALAL